MANVSTSRSAKSRHRRNHRADALFYGETPLVADAALQVRNISSALMGLAPEAWDLIRGGSCLEQLGEAVTELSATVAAMRNADDRDAGTRGATCLVAGVREGLRDYRRRLQFVASNIPLSDLHARGILGRLLGFDRWLGAHLQRCQDCQQEEKRP